MSVHVHTVEDTLLLVRLKASDRRAFDSLYTKYWEFVFNNAYKRLTNVSLAEDVVQEVFAQLWLRRTQEAIKNLPAYFYIAARNQVYKLQRKEQQYVPVNEIVEEVKSQYESADAQLLYKELLRAYKSLVERLPPQQREIFEMKYNENLEATEIAERLQVSPKTVRNQLGRALSRLRAALNIIGILLLISHLK